MPATWLRLRQPRVRGGRGYAARGDYSNAIVSPAHAGVEAKVTKPPGLNICQPRARGGRGCAAMVMGDHGVSAPRTRG